MNIEIYSVKDNKAGHFVNPFPSRGVTDAIRSITEVANNKESMLYKFAPDYSLYLVGKMDDLTGQIITECPMDPPTWKAPFLILDVQSVVRKEV